MENNHGATPAEWDHFSLVLDLTEDLLPVVSNPDAKISPDSKMRSLGKTPSRYNRAGQVAGIAKWTEKTTTQREVDIYRAVPDYGICIQTRYVRALDVDIDNNTVIAKDIYDKIHDTLEQTLPARRRNNSSKFLLAFTLEGEWPKRKIQTDYGIIEFLGNGQQFIAAGTNPSGARYEWADGLPDTLPALTGEQFENLWRVLTECFATDGTSDVALPAVKAATLAGAIKNDPTAQSLFDKGVVISTERDGRLHITCPFEAEHTAGGDESATTYFPAFTGGFERGHFHCLHAHCSNRTDGEFLAALGIATGAAASEFEVEVPAAVEGEVPRKHKYVFEPASAFLDLPPPTYHIKGVLPEAELIVVFGDSGSGKTFLALDMGFAVALGEPWRGLRTKQSAVAYIAAEDAHGVRTRARAYVEAHSLTDPPLYVLGAAPDFTDFDDMTEVARGIVRLPHKVGLVIVDTWSRVIAGHDENSAQDVTAAVSMCAKLYRATGATIMLIHHSGKDATRGARGSSVLRAAADGEIEVSRCDDDREAQVTKLKNGADGTRFGFRLKPVPAGTDEDGDVTHTCLVEHTEATTSKRDRKALEPRGVNEKLLLRSLDDLSIGGPITTAEVIDATVNHMPFDSASGKRDQRRKSAIVALNALLERGVLAVEGNEISRKSEE